MFHCRPVPPSLRLERVQLQNFRCFDELDFVLDEHITVVHADNGGGKTALLSGLAVALGTAVFEKSGNIRPADVRATLSGKSLTAVSTYPCRVEAQGEVDGAKVSWAREIPRPGQRTSNAEAKAVRARIDHLWRVEGRELPVVAFYGTQRLWGVVKGTAGKRGKPRREDGYVDALDPRSKEKQLLDWLVRASLSKLQRGASPEFVAVEGALRTALRHPADAGEFAIDAIEFDIATGEPVLRTTAKRMIRWSQLSDGEHVFAGLVADLARRCVTLNPHLKDSAVVRASGVVLIDEVDLHLHPRWQRVVLERLRAAFPSLQFVVSTHSPQVLSSVENAQVRSLRSGRLVSSPPVHGRDSNSVLREAFEAGERNESSAPAQLMHEVESALDSRKLEVARVKLNQLREAWSSTDPEVVRLDRILSWADSR
jgi:predicted ATP-binding protein involved in virulence